MLQVGPLKPVDLQLQLNSPRLSFEHIPSFLQGFGKQESDDIKKIDLQNKMTFLYYLINRH